MIRCVICRREEPGLVHYGVCRRCREETAELERIQRERQELAARRVELFEGGAGI